MVAERGPIRCGGDAEYSGEDLLAVPASTTAASLPPPAAEPDRVAYERCWADYIEWSGLDEDRLREKVGKRDEH